MKETDFLMNGFALSYSLKRRRRNSKLGNCFIIAYITMFACKFKRFSTYGHQLVVDLCLPPLKWEKNKTCVYSNDDLNKKFAFCSVYKNCK